MRPWPTSLRARLTVWYAALLGLPLIIFAIVCYVVFSRGLLDRTDRFIGDALSAFSRELVAERRATATLDQALATTITEVRFPDLRIAILDSARHIVAATASSRADDLADRRPSAATGQAIAEVLRSHDATGAFALTVGEGAGSYRVLAQPMMVRDQAFDVTGAYPLRDIEDVLARVRALFAIAIPLLVVCAGTGGYFLAKRSLAPVSAMTARASAISAANLDERLPVGGGTELVGLAQVVNALLDRLETSFDQQRRFMADASHELRTPTAIIRTEAEVTLSRDRDAAEYRGSVTVMRDAALRLTRIVEDLFLLARADSGHLVARRDALYLEELLHDAVRSVRNVADQKAVAVKLGAIIEAPFDGDADLLGRLFLNLLDNAIKYSASGAIVAVEMSRDNGRYRVDVTDSGPGIPADAQSRVFERFFRADAARARGDSSTSSGAGLGLAIGRRVAELHDGTLDLMQSEPGLTRFRVTLPAI